MMDEGLSEAKFYIGKKTEHIVIDKEIKEIVEIINDMLKKHSGDWAIDILRRVRAGEKDITIMIDSPVSANKYYDTKKEIVHRIYACCVAKGLISYEEIINEAIG